MSDTTKPLSTISDGLDLGTISIDIESWHSRPVEDALRAELAEEKRKNALLRAVAEAVDGGYIHSELTDEEYKWLSRMRLAVRDARKGGAM